MPKSQRRLMHVLDSRASYDGDGVKINRLADRRVNALLDPWLLLDEIHSDQAADYIGGFPQHPHRGFETITYMKTGRLHHRDHMGNEGVIGAGDVQWMTAGRGVLHSEMPEQQQGLLHGFQLWLNLPIAEKMKPPAYHDIASNQINEYQTTGGGRVRIIAGDISIDGQALSGSLPPLATEPLLLDVTLPAKQSVDIALPAEHSASVYLYRGQGEALNCRQLGIYSQGENLTIQAGTSATEFLVLGGKPLNEPIVQQGPFVMNTSKQIEQALMDYRSGQFP